MAETAQHHQPAFETDRELSKEQYPFLQTVYDPDSEDSSPENTSQSSSQKGGRPPLSSYLQLEETEEFAFSKQRIEENYPFFGTLCKRENGLMKRKEVIPRSEPKDIEYVKARYGAGAYQVRHKLEGGQEDRINFNVSGVEKADTSNTGEQVIDQEFITGLRREIKEEMRGDYEAEISRMERRMERQNAELDEYASKVRNLTVELAETDRRTARQSREDIKAYEKKIDELKEERIELRQEIFELEQELKYADADGGFDLKSMLKDAVNDPDVMKFLAPVIAKIFGGSQPVPQQPAALNGNTAHTQQGQENVRTREPAAPQEGSQNSDQPESRESTNESTQQEQMQHLIRQFSTNVIQNAASSMVHGNPDAGDLKKIVMQNVRQVERNGMELQPQMWINISKALIDVALQNDIPAEKAAETIQPILEQFDGAANQLKFVPAAGAAEYLINRFGITDINAQQKEFLVKVLKVFKQQIKQAS